MRAFANATGKRIGYEFSVKKRIEYAVDGVVQQPVSHRRLMNIPRLRVVDTEGPVAAMAVGAARQILVQ